MPGAHTRFRTPFGTTPKAFRGSGRRYVRSARASRTTTSGVGGEGSAARRARIASTARRTSAPDDDLRSLGVHYDPAAEVDEHEAVAAVRRHRREPFFAPDYREPEAEHARSLAICWSRLPVDARRALATKWLARCAARDGRAPDIDDPGDLHEISAKTLRAARKRGLAVGDAEAAAQERDVAEASGH